MNEKKITPTLILALLTPFIIGNIQMILTPALATISGMYPDLPYSSITLVGTIATLIAMPVNIIGGALAGKKVKYKTLILISAICLAGGSLPMFIPGYNALLFSRILVGIGCGFSPALGYPLVLYTLKGDAATRVSGMGTTAMNVTNVVVQIVGGVLAAASLTAVWSAHFVVLIFGVFTLLWLNEKSPSEEAAANAATDRNEPKESVPFGAWLYIIGFCLFGMAMYVNALNMSLIVSTENLGSAAVVGVLLAFLFAGGIVAGFVLTPLLKAFGGYVPAVLALTTAIGTIIVYLSHNLAGLAIGLFVIGLSHYCMWPGLIARFNEFVPVERMGLISGLVSAALSLGMFLSSPFITLVGSVTGSDSPRMPIPVGTVILLIIMVVFFFLGKLKKAE